MAHVPVLAGPALEWLAVRPDGVYVDCTAGAGGHSKLIAERCAEGKLIALDRDPEAVALAAETLRGYPHVSVLHRNYGELAEVLRNLGISRVDGVLIDAGVSSMQFDEPARGFSFQSEGPLDMRMDTSKGPTAREWLESVREEELAETLRRYGDLRQSRRIASAICRRRDQNSLETTRDLAAAVAEALPFVHGVPEETRTVFQAVRMALNEELQWLEKGVNDAISVLAPGGRLVVVTFHSGEDRVVKNLMREASRPCRVYHADGRVKETIPPQIRLLTRKPVRPSRDEIQTNPRAQSARLRAAERLEIEGAGSK